MLRINDSVEGATVAPASPSSARAAMSIPGLVENAASTDTAPNAAAPIMRRRRRPMRSPSVPMVISETGDEKPVDVDDPGGRGGGRGEGSGQRRHRQVEHGEVHGVEQARKREHGEADPFATSGLGGSGGGHAARPVWIGCRRAEVRGASLAEQSGGHAR